MPRARSGGIDNTLRENEQRFRDLLDNGHELMCTHALDGAIRWANKSALRLLGLSPEKIVRMRIQDILTPQALAAYPLYVDTLRRNGTANGIMAVVGRDQEVRLWEYSNTLHIEGEREPIVRGVARDVTEREDALRALRTSEKLFRSIIENTTDVLGIIESDKSARYYSPSAARALGYSDSELKALSFSSLVHPEDIARGCEFFKRQLIDPMATQTIKLRLRRRDGAWRLFEIAARTLMHSNRIDAVIVNARDVTERHLIDEQLEQANRLLSLGKLAATVAHEFNNVLMGMQPFAELLERHETTAEMAAKCGRHISGSIQRGKRVALDILRFTQPAAPLLKAVDFVEWWEQLLPELEAQCGDGITFAMDVPSPAPLMQADAGQLAQVMTNLVNNARDAMPRGGTITITVREPRESETFSFGIVAAPGQRVQISVKDEGSGIPTEVMRHVFDPLFTTKQNGGTGLGLAVAHQVITRHGGSIFVESALGRGSTFHFFVPKAEAAERREVKEPREIHAVNTRRICLIEDEEAIAEGISEVLSFHDIGVDAVTRGAEAHAAVRRFNPDVVLLDIGLPDVDGIEVGRRLRAVWPNLPIIFITGHGDEARIEFADERTRFLQKPFEMGSLIETIAELERPEVVA